ncbi:MAG: hypothetical protein JXA30_13265 [Deltaproteobacteria bacterium]|nr:hypothetical protein [Deltaproteobacteria bacterium]
MISNMTQLSYYLTAILLIVPSAAAGQNDQSAEKSEQEENKREEDLVGDTRQTKPEREETEQKASSEEQAETAAVKDLEVNTNRAEIESRPQTQIQENNTQTKQFELQNQSDRRVDGSTEPDPDSGNTDPLIALGLEIDTIWNTDPGFDLFSEDDVSTQVGFWFSYDLFSITREIVFVGEIGLGIGGVEDQPQKNLDLSWTMTSVRAYLAANLRYKLFSWIYPHLRVAGGACFGSMEFQLRDDPNRIQSADENTTSPFGNIGAGITLQTPNRMFENSSGAFASLSLGLLIEAGYTMASPMSLSLETATEDDQIEKRIAGLGDLDLSGPYVRTSVMVRF